MLKLVPTLALAVALTLPAGAREAGNYDGTWTVVLTTESGLCDARYSTSLAVQDGQVRPVAKTSTSSATVTGRVGPDGTVGLSVATSAASGTASGRLQAQNGAGIWQVSALCSGRWTAKRATTRTAQLN